MNPTRHKMGNEYIVKKFYLRCQHNQRQTGKHTKSTNTLKTTHNNKHTNCPAHMIVTVSATNRKHNGYLIEVDTKYTHNHLVNIVSADNKIPKGERQYLMNQVRKLVYAKTETSLESEYTLFQNNLIVK